VTVPFLCKKYDGAVVQKEKCGTTKRVCETLRLRGAMSYPQPVFAFIISARSKPFHAQPATLMPHSYTATAPYLFLLNNYFLLDRHKYT